MNLSACLRSTKIFNAISSPIFSALMELRIFILSNATMSASHHQHRPFDHTVLTHPSGQNSSGSLEDRLRKAKSFNVTSSIPSNSYDSWYYINSISNFYE